MYTRFKSGHCPTQPCALEYGFDHFIKSTTGSPTQQCALVYTDAGTRSSATRVVLRSCARWFLTHGYPSRRLPRIQQPTNKPTLQPHNHPTSQSRNLRIVIAKCWLMPDEPTNPPTKQRTNKLSNQPTNQLINQPTTTKQPPNQQLYTVLSHE